MKEWMRGEKKNTELSVFQTQITEPALSNISFLNSVKCSKFELSNSVATRKMSLLSTWKLASKTEECIFYFL